MLLASGTTLCGAYAKRTSIYEAIGARHLIEMARAKLADWGVSDERS